jgi:SAM-dependent methyltransferase
MLQNKTENYWSKTIDGIRRRKSYFDSYFDNEICKESLDFRLDILLGHDKNINSILDVGCGYGAFEFELLKRNPDLDLAGIDISDTAIDFCNNNIPNCKFVLDKLSNISNYFEENSYDMVFSSGVMIHQSPESIDEVTDNFIRIAKKYIIHFEDIGENELISGNKEDNPKWRISNQLLWRNNLVETYRKKGYNFYFNNNVPLPLQKVGFTNYIIVDLYNSDPTPTSHEDRTASLDRLEAYYKTLK